jgi:predicted SAM-dependent methyltransferase
MSYLRQVIDFSINAIGKIRRNRKVYVLKDERDSLVKVNLGCGLRVAKGWLNIDGSLNAMFASWPFWLHTILYRLSGSRQYYSLEQYCDILENHQFLYHDLSLSLPLHDNTVDFIYSSHFFEHLFKDDASKLLKACAKALKPEGIIRISIPDLAYAVSLYGHGRKAEMLDDYFFVEGKGSYLARHKYMYDFDLIKAILEEAGFSNVTRCEYQQGKTPDIEILDVYPDVSLFVEAIRGEFND